MPGLRQLQAEVLDAVLQSPGETGTAGAAGLVAANGIDPARRLGIYANNAAVNFLDSLRLSFPAVRRLVGDAYFAQTVRTYRDLHPSPSGDLQHAGAAFAAYLGALHGGDQYRYLADVARLEWLYQECLLAADHAPLDVARLAAVPAADYDDLRFVLHPSVRLFASDFPAQAIWEANLATDGEPEPIDLDRGAERIALHRGRGRVEFLHLSPGEQAFLGALAGRATLADALQAATLAAADFAPDAALQRFVRCAAIVDFST